MKKQNLFLLFLLPVLILIFTRHPGPEPADAAAYTVFLPQVTRDHPLTVQSGNLLLNPSFEEGWYHPNDIPELQIPNQWRFSWEEGDNPLVDMKNEPWNAWVRPEVRVMPCILLPPHECDIFIWGEPEEPPYYMYTVKIFKGWGSINFDLVTDVWLEPGMYLLEISFYPDLVHDYIGSEKVFAPDPLSGEFHFIIGEGEYDWWLPAFGQKNTVYKLFTVEEAGWVTVGAAMRGRWALENNGWFMDDWRLVRVGSG